MARIDSSRRSCGTRFAFSDCSRSVVFSFFSSLLSFPAEADTNEKGSHRVCCDIFWPDVCVYISRYITLVSFWLASQKARWGNKGKKASEGFRQWLFVFSLTVLLYILPLRTKLNTRRDLCIRTPDDGCCPERWFHLKDFIKIYSIKHVDKSAQQVHVAFGPCARSGHMVWSQSLVMWWIHFISFMSTLMKML